MDVTGMGNVAPSESNMVKNPGMQADMYGKYYKIATDLFWLDDSLAAIRVYDVIRALDLLEDCNGVDSNDIRLYLHGRYGVYGQLAALVDNRIKGMEIIDGIGSYGKLVKSRYYSFYDAVSLIIPGMLKYFDLGEIVTNG